MTKTRLVLSMAGWVVVAIGWFYLTRSFHPTTALAIIVTASLMLAYALAAYANELWLIPKYWRRNRIAYWLGLLAIMALFTAAALTVIRVSYFQTLGPDPDPNGTLKHYAIDFFGMTFHVAAFSALMRPFRA